ncbi:MAG: undecaprenyl-phosphate glucose phosphotransferase [Deltaproteobacteria bacterium]|nr:MAG: undecaprenyl-phosphate glucose phosphotransferase [Deltaproteobacteria bacterium]
MLYRYNEIFRSTLLLTDLALVAGAWVAAYGIRFYTVLEAPLGIPPFAPYAQLLALILPLWFWLFRSRGLYEPQRTGSMLGEAGNVIAATTVGTVVLVAATFFLRSYYYSRGVMLIFYGLSALSVIGFRLSGRLVLRSLRRRGYNLRHLLVVGAGELAQRVIERVHEHPETGVQVVGVLSSGTGRPGDALSGAPVLGSYEDVAPVIREHGVQQVIIALPRQDADHLEKIAAALEDEVVTVRMVPDLLHVMTLNCSVDDLGGLPMINLREGPLEGWAGFQKRVFDAVVSGAALLLAAPLLAAIALAIRATSGRPVLYAQDRMGLDGRVFRMQKFRTMVDGAEQATGPVWAGARDPRRTRLGALLRRTSLDELPQLWNVLRGDMSLVGPRPERPFFIQQFRREIPGYMQRHKVKAGMTGWAQVHGWRGDTSLDERLEHDIYYIQNWSLGLDVWILLMTLFRTTSHRNAH